VHVSVFELMKVHAITEPVYSVSLVE